MTTYKVQRELNAGEELDEDELHVYIKKNEKGAIKLWVKTESGDTYPIARLSTKGNLVLYKNLPEDIGLRTDSEGVIETDTED